MTFVTPTLDELLTRVEADVATRTGVGVLLPVGTMKALARTLAGAAYLQHLHLEWTSRQVLPSTADSELLDEHANWRGVPRKAATFSQGPVLFTGADTSAVPAGTEVQRADGVRYTTDVAGVIAGGTASVPVTAVEGGLIADSVVGTELSLTQPVTGLDGTATVDTGGLVGGEDQESDTALLERLYQHYRNPPLGGALGDYVTWALEVPGVTRAWAIHQQYGVGTVGVTFAVDDDPSGPIPDAAKVAEVLAYVTARKPVTAAVFVSQPVALPLTFTIQLTPNTAEVQAEVTAALQDLILRDGEPNSTFLLSRIREAVSNAPGESDNLVQIPAADTPVNALQIPTFGGVTYV